VTGLDVTPAQLETARRCQRETGIEFPLVEASAEDVPLPDASFDLALSEYGASIWCDPQRWIPEAARLLRPGGELVFLCNSPLSLLCAPDEGRVEDRLVRPQFDGLGRMEWPGEEGVDFHLGHGEWLALLRENGFEVEALHELRAPEDAQDHSYYEFVPAAWARKWPAEDLWHARKRA
jgi:SAM-dependent methyltransferase